MKNVRERLLDKLHEDPTFKKKWVAIQEGIKIYLTTGVLPLEEDIGKDQLVIDLVNNFDSVCKHYKIEKSLLEKKHEVFEKQVKRLEAALGPDMQTGAFIKGHYVSDYARFQSMCMQNTPPGKELQDSELDYINKRAFELNDLILTISKDQENIMKIETFLHPPHQDFLIRLEKLKSMIGKSILHFAPMGSALLHIWSLLQDDIKTAEKKFDSMREDIELLLVESGTITMDKLEEAKTK